VGYVHFGESALLREVRWVPVVQTAAFFLFIALGFLGFRSAKVSEQRFIWIGMAKETAHQLGTPISSLMGWVELLRSRAKPAPEHDGKPQIAVTQSLFEETMGEMESDVERLNKIAFRFSQVGSEPQRKLQNLVPIVAATVTYMKRRLPRLEGRAITIAEHYEEVPPLNLNSELIEWVIENLIKNAVAGIASRSRSSAGARPRWSRSGSATPAGGWGRPSSGGCSSRGTRPRSEAGASGSRLRSASSRNTMADESG
jgi:hypothetical protein